MERNQEQRPDPLTLGKGRSDEVDQSKGIFRPETPHPEGAEVRAPGELGGGPYEESGRGNPAGSLEERQVDAGAAGAGAAAPPAGELVDSDRAPDEGRPAGALPPHGDRRL